MANVFFRRRPTRIDPGPLGDALRRVLAEAGIAGVEVVVAERGRQAELRWEDGPSSTRVAALVAEVVNWDVRGPDSGSSDGDPVVILDRSFSPTALAVGVVRYAAAHPRPYDSTDERAVARLSALLDQDDPAVSGYPIADQVARLLLERGTPDRPAASGDTTPADRLALALADLGYDRLWHEAWRALP